MSALPGLAYRATSPAPLTGVEPAASTVTGWRALHLLYKGVSFSSERPAGVEPAHPPWQSGRPAVTSRARCVVCLSQASGRSRTCAAVLPRRQATVTTRRRFVSSVSPPGIEPGPQPSESCVRPAHSEDISKSTRRELNPRLRRGKPARCHYATSTFSGTGRIRTSTSSVKSRECRRNTSIPFVRESPVGESNPHLRIESPAFSPLDQRVVIAPKTKPAGVLPPAGVVRLCPAGGYVRPFRSPATAYRFAAVSSRSSLPLNRLPPVRSSVLAYRRVISSQTRLVGFGVGVQLGYSPRRPPHTHIDARGHNMVRRSQQILAPKYGHLTSSTSRATTPR